MKHPGVVAAKALSWLAAFVKDQFDTPSTACLVTASWMHPPAGKLKVNVDRSWDCSSKCGGVGIIVSNCYGVFVAARVARFDDVHSPAHIEALAAREGMSLCLESGHQNSVLESDGLQIMMALHDSLINRSIIGPIIIDAKVLLSTIIGGFSAHVR
ncbi:hypothetical protein COP2_003664 [Malus domestica]